jgi:hypothetical protein
VTNTRSYEQHSRILVRLPVSYMQTLLTNQSPCWRNRTYITALQCNKRVHAHSTYIDLPGRLCVWADDMGSVIRVVWAQGDDDLFVCIVYHLLDRDGCGTQFCSTHHLPFNRWHGGSCAISVVGGICADIYHDPRSRGRSMAIFMVCSLHAVVMVIELTVV